MSTTIPSPNMSLSIPVVGVDPGPQYALDINACLTVIDGHNHSPGYGVQITPAGFNINTDLTFNSNNATFLRSVRFAPQITPISGASDIGCLYESGVDLYYNDGSGNQIRMTSGGTVNATSSGITSGTATASFVGGVLVVNAASNTPANIQAGSILLGNNIASSKFLTLSPPNAMAVNYPLVLPSLPGSPLFMTLDTSGNMGTATGIQGTQIATGSLTAAQLANQTITSTQIANNTITATQIANQTITATQIANNTITRNQQAAVGQQNSNSSGLFGIAAGAPPATVLTVTITTTGRPVIVSLQGDSTANAQYIGVADSSGFSVATDSGGYTYSLEVLNPTSYAKFEIFRNGTSEPFATTLVPQNTQSIPLTSQGFMFVDPVGAGTYTYTLVVTAFSSTGQCTAYVYHMGLVVYEL